MRYFAFIHAQKMGAEVVLWGKPKADAAEIVLMKYDRPLQPYEACCIDHAGAFKCSQHENYTDGRSAFTEKLDHIEWACRD